MISYQAVHGHAAGGRGCRSSASGLYDATLSYTPATDYTAVTGSFGGNVTAAISANEEKMLLSLSGAPSGGIEKALKNHIILQCFLIV